MFISKSEIKLNHRVYELDILRFIALMMVVFFHYMARKHSINPINETHHFYLFTDIARYGHLGVNLFFIISGFVIIASSATKTSQQFLVARMVRLYPAFWICCVISAIFLLTFGYPIDARSPDHVITLEQILINMTMFSGYLGFEYIDVVYWSLQVELKFYFLIVVLIFLKQIKNIEAWLWLWLLITVVLFLYPYNNLAIKILKSLSIFPYSPYFLAGIMFFIARQSGFNWSRAIHLIVCCGLAVMQADMQANLYITQPSDQIVLITQLIVVAFFALFMMVSAGWLQMQKRKLVFYLGALTYPMYLLHNMIGKVIYDNLVLHTNKYVSLSVVILLLGVLSLSIFIFIEQKYKKAMLAGLNNIFMKLSPLKR